MTHPYTNIIKWLLPEQLMMAIGFHHSPQDAPGCIQYPLIVQVADVLSLMLCHSDSIDAQDVENNFNDLLPDVAALWQRNNLSWQPEMLEHWIETLLQHRDNEQGVVSIFSSE